MGKHLLLLLGLNLLLLLFGTLSVSAAPSATSPASKLPILYHAICASFFCFHVIKVSFFSLFFTYPSSHSSEVVSGFLSNAVPAITKWVWSLKATTKTGTFRYVLAMTHVLFLCFCGPSVVLVFWGVGGFVVSLNV